MVMIWKGTHGSSIPTLFDRVIAMGNGGQKILRDSLDQNRYSSPFPKENFKAAFDC